MSTGIRGGKPGKPPKEALLFQARKLMEIGRGGLLGASADNVTIADLVDMVRDRYRAENRKSLENVVWRTKYLKDRYGHWKAKEFTTDRMLAYALARREKDGAAVATVNQELTYLRRAYTVAVEAGRCTHVPRVPRLPGTHVRQGFLDDDVLSDMLELLAPYYGQAVRFLRLTGWRENECLGLEWRRVDWPAQEIRLATSKTGEPRTLPFGTYPQLAEILREQRAEADRRQQELGAVIPFVFFGRTGKRISASGLQRAWQRARKKAGYPDLIVHDLRRTLVREMERKGVPRSVAMQITGHRSEEVYRRYAIVARRDVEEGLSRLSAEGPPDVIRKIRQEKS